MSEYHACCWGELFWQRLDTFFYLWRRAMRSDGVKPIASLFKIRTPNNCGNIDDKARRGNCSERVWLKAHVRKAEAIKGLVYFKSKEDMLRAWWIQHSEEAAFSWCPELCERQVRPSAFMGNRPLRWRHKTTVALWRCISSLSYSVAMYRFRCCADSTFSQENIATFDICLFNHT